MLRNAEGLVRLGMLALPLAGLLALVGLYSTVKLGSGGILATGENRAIVSAGYLVSVLLGSMLALTVLIFGVVALYAYLANGGQRTLALGAMVSSIVGIALMLSRLGVFAYAVPALSRSFLDDNPESIRIVDSIFTGPLETVASVSILLYSAGFVLFGVAIWRSGVLPRWAGVLVRCSRPAGLRAVPGGGFGRGRTNGARGWSLDRLQCLAGHPWSKGIPGDATCRASEFPRDLGDSDFRWM